MRIPRVLVIAGSDSGGGAGIQADIKTVTMLGGHAMTAVTAITAQNTLGVADVMAVPAEMVLAQIDTVVSDIGVDAVKIGMIGSAETAHAVAGRIERMRGVPVVFDPVMIATSGDMLADEDTVQAFQALMAVSTVVTPNAEELTAMTGLTLGSEQNVGAAAAKLIDVFGCAVLATGQRLPGEMRYADGRRIPGDRLLYDLLYSGHGSDWQEWSFHGERIETVHDHGTGCTLSSAIATGLAARMDLPDAITRARDYVRAALLAAPALGGGRGPMGHALGGVPFDRAG